MDGPIHVAAAGQDPVRKASAFLATPSPDSMQQQNSVTLIIAFQMSCAVLGSSLTIMVGVKMFFEHQKHADTGELKHDATLGLLAWPM